MWLDLGGVRVVLQADGFNESAGDHRPIDIGSGRHVRVEVAHRAIPFAENRDVLPTLFATPEACDEVGDFFAERRRAGGLTVRACEHGRISVTMRQCSECRGDSLDRLRKDHARRGEKPGVTDVVDVFRRTAEVHQFECGLGCACVGKLAAYVVLDGLHVMIDGGLDGLDSFGRIRWRLVCKLGGAAADLGRQGRPREVRRVPGEMDQPERLDPDSLADEAGFGQVGSQRFGRCAVSAVDGRKCVERSRSHEF